MQLVLAIIILVVIVIVGGIGNLIDTQERHTNDYGKVARCPKCGSSRVYAMTYDDKRASINFWGTASSKIGKRYHCDNCNHEW